MATIEPTQRNNGVKRESAPTQRIVPTERRAAMATDRLTTSAPACQELCAQAQLDGRPVDAWITDLHGRAHHAGWFTRAITDAELRREVNRLVYRAQHVSSDAELAQIGADAQDLLDRVNATAPGRLSNAMRAYAANAVLPLAEANQFDELLSQARTMLKASDPKARRQAARFMIEHGMSLRNEIDHLDVPRGMIDRMEQEVTTLYNLSLSMFDSKDEDKENEKIRAARAAWAAWYERGADFARQMKAVANRG